MGRRDNCDRVEADSVIRLQFSKQKECIERAERDRTEVSGKSLREQIDEPSGVIRLRRL